MFSIGSLFSFEVDIEGLKKFAILILWGDDPYAIAQFGAEHLEGVLVQGLRSGGHLTEVEHDCHEVSWVDIDLLSEVREGRSLSDLHFLIIPARNRHATNGGCGLLFKFLALGTLGLTSTLATATAATKRTWR